MAPTANRDEACEATSKRPQNDAKKAASKSDFTIYEFSKKLLSFSSPQSSVRQIVLQTNEKEIQEICRKDKT